MVMPTGFGKTAVEWMVMAEFIRLYDKKLSSLHLQLDWLLNSKEWQEKW